MGFKPVAHTLQMFWLEKIIVVKLNKSIIYRKYVQYFFSNLLVAVCMQSHTHNYILRVYCLKMRECFRRESSTNPVGE